MQQYDPVVMQQRDCNARATMIRAMNFFFKSIKDIVIYLDSILIANHTYVEDNKTVKEVMKIAQDNKLCCNKTKCQCMPARMQILETILPDQGL